MVFDPKTDNAQGYWYYQGDTRYHTLSKEITSPPEWYIAILEGNIDFIKEAVQVNKRLMNENYHGQTPFTLALAVSDIEITQLLVEHMDDNKEYALTALEQLRRDYTTPSNANTVTPYLVISDRSLVFSHYSWGFERNRMPKWYIAIIDGDEDAIRTAIEQNPNLAKERYHEKSPLEVALKKPNLEIIRLLCEHSADNDKEQALLAFHDLLSERKKYMRSRSFILTLSLLAWVLVD